jgi:SAM-dependent methyltransferase
MTEKHSWEVFFDAHAPIYDQQVYTTNTVSEVDFLIDELQLLPGIRCSTSAAARVAIRLNWRNGDTVTGLDLSSEMLLRADAAAKAANVSVQWIRGDATSFEMPERFDAAICLCEGAFGLLGQDDDPIDQPLSILSNLSRSLKPDGRTLFTVLNGAAMLRRHQNLDVSEGRFDPLTMVESSEVRRKTRFRPSQFESEASYRRN